jgi:transcriptional regulator with XRE-family HTH domain
MYSADDEEESWRDAFALRLRAIIVLREIAARDAARALGISESRFNNWLQGIAVPPAYYLYLIRKRFGVSLDYLLNEDLTALPPDLATALLKGPRSAIRKKRPDLLKRAPTGPPLQRAQ